MLRTRQSYPLKAAVDRSGLPLVSPWRVEVCSIRLPGGDVLPSSQECFRRVVHLALLKLPFFVRGSQQGYVGAPPFAVKPQLFPPKGSEKSGAGPTHGAVNDRHDPLNSDEVPVD